MRTFKIIYIKNIKTIKNVLCYFLLGFCFAFLMGLFYVIAKKSFLKKRERAIIYLVEQKDYDIKQIQNKKNIVFRLNNDNNNMISSPKMAADLAIIVLSSYYNETLAKPVNVSLINSSFWCINAVNASWTPQQIGGGMEICINKHNGKIVYLQAYN